MFSGLQQAQPVLIEPQGEVKKVVIWLHGLGADGHDFEEVVPLLGLPDSAGIRFIFPHAPINAVTINNGMQMRSWYDIRSEHLLNDVDADGIKIACAQVYELIENQLMQGIAEKDIILVGFSQGGLVALHSALKGQYSLGGVLALSTYCPMTEQFASHKTLPIMMMHGLYDPVVPLAVAEMSRESITQQGYQVEWHTYPMAHQVCNEELQQIGSWLLKR